MKTILIIIFLLFTLSASAPEDKRLTIVRAESVKPYDPILNAFMFVESNYRTDVVSSLGYTGLLQIGQEMTDEANRINKLSSNPIRFKFPQSALDSLQSVQIWYTVQSYWNKSYSVKRACKVWNPLASGRYYNKVRANL
jgi:hypothetical protein